MILGWAAYNKLFSTIALHALAGTKWDRVLKFLLPSKQLEADIVNLCLCLLNSGLHYSGIPDSC